MCVLCVCSKLQLSATNMDSTNISNWTIDSEIPHQLSNYSADLVNDTETQDVAMAILVMCTLGLPGNLFILAVYVVKMANSTRVYMFALAIADSAVCVSGIVLSMAFSDMVTNIIFIGTIDVFTTFSMFILAFVSIERVLAVRRPHTFSLHPLRAKKSLCYITLVTCIFETLLRMFDFTGNEGVVDILGLAVLMSCIVVIVTCYTLIAVTLLQKARGSRVKTGVINRTYPSAQPGTSRQNQATTSISVAVPDTNKATAAKAKNVRGVRLLFLITVVFVCAWLPQWLSSAGVPIPSSSRRLFLVNCFVNPYIYGFASPMFREDVRDFIRQVRNWLTGCCLLVNPVV